MRRFWKVMLMVIEGKLVVWLMGEDRIVGRGLEKE